MELSFHVIETAYPRICRRARLLKWGCDPSLLRVIQMLLQVDGGLVWPRSSRTLFRHFSCSGLRHFCSSSPGL